MVEQNRTFLERRRAAQTVKPGAGHGPRLAGSEPQYGALRAYSSLLRAAGVLVLLAAGFTAFLALSDEAGRTIGLLIAAAFGVVGLTFLVAGEVATAIVNAVSDIRRCRIALERTDRDSGAEESCIVKP